MKKIFLLSLFLFSCTIVDSQAATLGSNGWKENAANQQVFKEYINFLYQSCDLSGYHLSKELFYKSVVGYYNLKSKEVHLKSIISIVDFDKPSTEKRLWIIDLNSRKVLFHSLVAHGKNSGSNTTLNFSNIPNSNMSSLGFYVTRNTYQGKHGLSLIIDGMDKNVNCNARSRSIVIHGAEYVSDNFIKCTGRLGRSQGCPAVPVELHREIISAIQGGSVLFINKSSGNYRSQWLDEEVAINSFGKLIRIKA